MIPSPAEVYSALLAKAAPYLDGGLPQMRHPKHSPQSVHAGSRGGAGGGIVGESSSGGAGGGGGGGGGDPNLADDADEFDNAGRFSDSYRRRYGDVVGEHEVGGKGRYSVVITDKKSLHLADDVSGTKNRTVLQQFTPKSARSLSNDVFAVADGAGARTNTATGAKLRPDAGTKSSDGMFGVNISWSGGLSSAFDGDEAFELQEGLSLMADSFARQFGTR